MTDNQDSVTAGAVQPPTDRPLTAGDVLRRLMDDYQQLADMPGNAAVWVGGASTHSGDRDPSKVYLDEVRAALSTRPATSAASEVEGVREAIVAAVKSAMNEAWCDITSDTDCWPADLKRVSQRGPMRLEYHPAIWTDTTAELAANAILAALASPPVSERERELEEALRRAADDLRDIGSQNPRPSNSPDPEHENYLRRTLISLAQLANTRARQHLTAQPAGEGK